MHTKKRQRDERQQLHAVLAHYSDTPKELQISIQLVPTLLALFKSVFILCNLKERTPKDQ